MLRAISRKEPPVQFKIMGREPALFVALVAAGLSFLVCFGFTWLSAEQASIWLVVINALLGVITAILTRPVAPAAFTYFVTSVFTLLGAYGLAFSQEMVGGINAFVVAVLAFVMRGQVSPSESPVTKA